MATLNQFTIAHSNNSSTNSSTNTENDPTKNWQSTILFYVNGERHEITKPNPNTTLANYLRKKLHLTGTKVACGEGGCGACTVLVSHYDHLTNFVVNRSVNACLFPLIQIDGCAIVTVEGIGNNHSEDVLHLIQQRFREFGASQCGFCTPGFVMALYSLLRNNPHPSLEEISRAFDGNLCRCTGYRSIFEAAATFARVHEDSEYHPAKSVCSMGDNCCKKTGESSNDCGGGNSNNNTSNNNGCGKNDCCKKSPTHENDQHSRSNVIGKHLYNLVGQKHPLFPHELRRYNPNERSLCVESPVQSGSDRHETKTIYYRPSNLNEFLYLRKKYEHEKHLRIICGNTELGIETKFKKFDHYRYYIEAVRIPELLVKKVNYIDINNTINNNNDTINNNDDTINNNDNDNNNRIAKSIEIGASLTLTNLYNYLKSLIDELPEYQIQGIKAVCEQIERFASNSVRNAASLGGNIVTASPISDLNPLWLAMDCSLNIMNSNGNIRIVPFNQFFLGYRKVNLLDDEIVISINIPLFNHFNTLSYNNINNIDNINNNNTITNNNNLIEIVHSYKQSKRREDDIAIVTSGMRMIIDKSNGIIRECKISFGGMSFKTLLADETSKYLIGKELNEQVFLQSLELLKQDVPLKENAPGGMIEYRCSLTLSFLYKFYISVLKESKLRELTIDEESVLESQFIKPYPRGEQVYRPLKEQGTSVGKPIPHNYSHLQVTGEATYVQDIPPQSREAYAYPVLSTKPFAIIKKVDYNRALTFEGVITWVDYKDVKGSNRCGAVIHDEEELFLTSETTSCGQLIGFIIADSHLKAMTAAKSVHVEYEEYQNPILSIQDALQFNAPSLIDRRIFRGDAINRLNEIKQLINNDNSNNNNNNNNNDNNDNNDNTTSDNSNSNSNEEYEIIEGDLNIGGQEHFYFETQSCLILPGRYGMSGDEGEYVVFSSTQSPTHTQSIVASALGIPDHKVISKLKRLGGGFGGKESRSCILAGAVAVAAQKTNRPVRCILDRDVDMQSSGQRHPFYSKYKIVINKKTLKFETVLVDTYANGGYSLDYSKGVLERALYSFDNVYYFPHIDLKGKALKTNLPTNTAFRGFGGPQGLMICEHIIEHVSHYLSVKYPNLINQFILNHLNQYNILKNVILPSIHLNDNINDTTINNINDTINNTNNTNNINNNTININTNNNNNIQLSHLIRQVNMYEKENAITPYKMPIGDVHRIILMWDRIIEITKYQERLQQVNEFNSKNKYQKRGLSLIPTKFAISFGVSFLNQASALINIYSHDGSVYVSHAGTEMGQGVSIKVAQCVASSLGIPIELIHIGETSTDKVPNTSATAASVGSDLNGFAAKNACEKINQQLSSLKQSLFPHLFKKNYSNESNTQSNDNTQSNQSNQSNDNTQSNQSNNIQTNQTNGENNNNITTPQLSIEEWKKLVKEAYMKCIPLTATGYYNTPNLYMDWDKSEGTPFSYFTYGVACSEVQIDTLTGDWTCLKTDIVMDVGDSLNPTIDIGQIEGAFIQGMGYYTMEELIFGDKEHPWVQPGHLFTKGPGNYKIPSGNDIPNEFNVHLLRDEQNRQFPSSVFSSKGVGEPPLFLASSVLFAIRNAIADFRSRNCNNPSYFILDSPCTCERIRMLCEDDFTRHFYNKNINDMENNENNNEHVENVAFRAKGSF
ncbi:predicted protein [Naegleria gruberi]|uniref:Predicted protein n=1 Tax=Naegleria gruberi TaxID=5762 RepID=D2V1W1_NAEGR|nr:uncharacterized protein NAEGRDRAFT_62716 [Naegleria gruberi]EFC49230.1 predicted protein [Naegleria gruberi]|eukprot:XP_002681974.1 predicted protein [Naegleria gruberi strain NEG-M]